MRQRTCILLPVADQIGRRTDDDVYVASPCLFDFPADSLALPQSTGMSELSDTSSQWDVLLTALQVYSVRQQLARKLTALDGVYAIL